jgi:hypothetical protein
MFKPIFSRISLRRGEALARMIRVLARISRIGSNILL